MVRTDHSQTYTYCMKNKNLISSRVCFINILDMNSLGYESTRGEMVHCMAW
jgi:hypothetical protein